MAQKGPGGLIAKFGEAWEAQPEAASNMLSPLNAVLFWMTFPQGQRFWLNTVVFPNIIPAFRRLETFHLQQRNK
jgi:hypothetical protein